ncbi:MAG: hypothetical protein ACPLZ9_06590, partial [Candidatus Ratteibacteria bacterium]
VGTISIEKAEKLSKILERKRIPHRVLHGKNHEAEAAIIAQAGKLKSVTIATQMAGRGVDIILGGNPEIIAREETVKILWSRKREKKNIKTEFLDIINEIEEKYKKRQEEIEKTIGENLKSLKEKLVEKEKILSEKEKKVKELFEKEIFEKNSNGLFEKYKTKLLKLKSIYEKNNEKLKEMSVQYKDKPERLKEIKEITGKSYREYINYKNNLKRQFGIYLREDIEEKRSNLVEQIEKKESQLPNTIEQLQKIIFLYLKILENTYPEIFSYEEIEKGKKKINKYFEFLKDLKNISVIEGEKIIQEVKRKEFTFYELLENFLNEIEKEIFKNYAPDYIEIEKEYEKTLREYERLQNKYTEELNIAREEYEKERSKYEEEWKKIREDMEKSPEEFKEIYEKLLEKYKKPWEE